MSRKNKKKGGRKKEDVVAGSSGSTPVSGGGQQPSEGQGSEQRNPQLTSSGLTQRGSVTGGLTREEDSTGQLRGQPKLQGGERQVSEKQKECIPSTSGQIGEAGGKGSGDLKSKISSSNWKPFPDTQKVVVPKEPGTWALRRIPVSVNHFRIEGIPKIIYQYDAKCALIRAGGGQGEPQQPKRVPKYLTESLLKWVVANLKKKSGHQAIASNLSNFLYTTKKLEDLGMPLQYEYTVGQLKQAGIIPKENADEQETSFYKVTFQFADCGDTGGIIDATPVINHLAKNGTLKGFIFPPGLEQTLEAAFNAFIKGVPQIPFISVGKSTIVPWGEREVGGREGFPLGEGLQAWKGISMNVGMGWKPYLNLEITNTAFVIGATVLNALKEVLNLREVGDVSKLGRPMLEKARSYLKRIKVQYKVDGKKFTKTVRDVFDFGANDPRTKFDWNGEQVTVFEYFNRRYNANLQFRNGLLLMTSKDGKIKIPAELCVIKDGQSVNRKLTGRQTDNMIKFARKSPKDHHDNILNKFEMCKFKENGMLKELGCHFPDEGMLKIQDAQVLVPPSIKYGDLAKKEGKSITPENGAWKFWGLEKLVFYQSPDKVTKWGVLVVGCANRFYGDGDRNYNFLLDFIQLLKDEGRKKGVTIDGNPIEVFDKECQNFSYKATKNLQVLRTHFSKFKKDGCQFVLVVTPGKRDPIYGHVKHAAEVDVGILTQCVQLTSVIGGQKYHGPSRSLVQNLILKLNMKLGGINHVVMPPLNPKLAKMFCNLLNECPVLVLGGDVTHPPPGSKKFMVDGEQEPFAPSYAAVTGSLDKTCMPYMTEVRAQRKAGAGAAEVIQDMENIVLNMIQNFYFTSGETLLPLKIIYFRDGVGKGQFEELKAKEMIAIRRACSRISKDVVEKIMGKGKVYEPPITFITVQKRHKTRIFQDKDGIKNPPAGTVIYLGSGVFMCSHEGSLGTSRPCQYECIWDDSDFSWDEILSLAYTLCHMFARCTKSVKMPAPTYYAHLAADRAKKLCEGFEIKPGETSISIANLNTMLARDKGFRELHPMHFI